MGMIWQKIKKHSVHLSNKLTFPHFFCTVKSTEQYWITGLQDISPKQGDLIGMTSLRTEATTCAHMHTTVLTHPTSFCIVCMGY